MGSEHAPLTVFATNERGTLAALQHAKSITARSPSPVLVLVPELVEYGTPFRARRVNGNGNGNGHENGNGTGSVERSFRDLASRVGLDVAIRTCQCREPKHVSGRLGLAPSRIVLGGRWRGWLATSEQQLARELACDGHDVTFVDVDTGATHHFEAVHA